MGAGYLDDSNDRHLNYTLNLGRSVAIFAKYRTYYENMKFDLAVIKAKRTFAFNELLGAVPLVEKDSEDLAVGETCLVAGWGDQQGNNISVIRVTL